MKGTERESKIDLPTKICALILGEGEKAIQWRKGTLQKIVLEKTTATTTKKLQLGSHTVYKN